MYVFFYAVYPINLWKGILVAYAVRDTYFRHVTTGVHY